MIPVGIDLGTSNSVCAYFIGKRSDRVQFGGDYYLPSLVCIEKDQNNKTSFSLGSTIKDYMVNHPERVAYGSKRLIGRKFNDPYVQNFIKTCPYEIINKNDRPAYVIEGNTYDPETISAQILLEIKNQFKKTTGNEMKSVVITIPALFSPNQRECTKTAAELAGLDVIQFISEPTAAAIAYKDTIKDQGVTGKQTVLIFDFGAGTLDVSIVAFENDDCNIIAVEGNVNLGGKDLDKALYDFVVRDEQKTHPNFRFDPKSKECANLLEACEKCKINLSTMKSSEIIIPNFYKNGDLQKMIRRIKFESLIEDKIQACIESLDKALQKAKLSKDQITAVIPIGGSCNIPAVQTALEDYFDGKTCIVMADSCGYSVAQGAMLLCKGLLENTTKFTNNISRTRRQMGKSSDHRGEIELIKDILPMPFGIRIDKDKFFPYFSPGTSLPSEIQYPFKIEAKRSLKLEIFQGEDLEHCSNNDLIAQTNIQNIPSNIDSLWVKLKLDVNGVMTVYVCDNTGTMEREQKLDALIQLSENDFRNAKKILDSTEQISRMRNDFDTRIDNLSHEVSRMKRKSTDKRKFSNLEDSIDELLQEREDMQDKMNGTNEIAKLINKLQKLEREFQILSKN